MKNDRPQTLPDQRGARDLVFILRILRAVREGSFDFLLGATSLSQVTLQQILHDAYRRGELYERLNRCELVWGMTDAGHRLLHQSEQAPC